MLVVQGQEMSWYYTSEQSPLIVWQNNQLMQNLSAALGNFAFVVLTCFTNKLSSDCMYLL